MQIFYLDSDDMLEDWIIKLSEEKSIIENKLNLIKEIINRSELFNRLQQLNEKDDFKQVKL